MDGTARIWSLASRDVYFPIEDAPAPPSAKLAGLATGLVLVVTAVALLAGAPAA